VHLMRTRMDGVHHKDRNISSAYLYETNARLYINRDLSPVFLRNKLRKTPLKWCHQFAHRARGPL